jgi:hypothetical protein
MAEVVIMSLIDLENFAKRLGELRLVFITRLSLHFWVRLKIKGYIWDFTHGFSLMSINYSK